MQNQQKVIKAQEFLQSEGLDGWLLYDFHGTNPLARRFLELPSNAMSTRRYFYWIPSSGDPQKIVHAIESRVLDGWMGEKKIYLSWQSLHEHLRSVLSGARRVAMEYSPANKNPYISHVDGGTIDLIRSMGVEVLSSGGFLCQFTAVLSENQRQSHLRTAEALNEIVGGVRSRIRYLLSSGSSVTELEIQKWILDEFEKRRLITESTPIIAVNEHSSDPHYEVDRRNPRKIEEGDFLLIDLWAKEQAQGSVFGDITKVAVVGRKPREKEQLVFDLVRKSQKEGIALVRTRFQEKKKLMGYEVDDAVRGVIVDAGFGQHFFHKTGHSIDTDLHGSGAHLDNLEMHDDRPILPSTCFSIEPGVYLSREFGIRLESDILIDSMGRVQVTGGEQELIDII